MPVVSKPTQFDSGEVVYARFLGSESLVVPENVKTGSPFPHYLCEREGVTYLIPMIHLSTKNLLPLVEDGNHRQVSLFPALAPRFSAP